MSRTLPTRNAIATGRSYWICAVSLARNGDRKLVYGCAAPSQKETGWTKKIGPIALASGGELYFEQATITNESLTSLREKAEQGTLDLSSVLSNKQPIQSIAQASDFLGFFLGQTASKLVAFRTFPDLDQLFGADGDDLAFVLEFLQNNLNLPFRDRYVTHLGNFEIADLQSWLDWPPPFVVEPETQEQNEGRRGVRDLALSRSVRFCDDEHMAHIVCLSDGSVIADRIVVAPSGERRVPLYAGEQVIDSFEFRLFDATGKHLLHHDSGTYIQLIGLNMTTAGRTIEIKDKFSERAKSRAAKSAGPVTNVPSLTTQRSIIEVQGERSAARAFSERAVSLRDKTLPKASDDRWFPNSIENEIAVIEHFNTLLSGSRVRRAILVDPFFGPDALRRVLMRMRSQDVDVTIVTSWTTSDPDTGTFIASGTEKLDETLMLLRSYLNPRLTLINIVDGTEQAFHDRYLLLYPHEGLPQIYLLSNSLNKLAGRWPFCMSRLADDIREVVQKYIEGLADGKDVTQSTTPRITFRWPRTSSKPT